MGRHTASVVFIEPLLGELKRGIFEDAEWGVALHRFQGNGALSIERIVEDEPDLIVLDYFFGQEKSARDLIAGFRGNSKLRDVPILACRYPDQAANELMKSLEGSVSTVISRPYSVEDFMDKATDLVDRVTNRQ
jgi:CheY-like chemotaxis protein